MNILQFLHFFVFLFYFYLLVFLLWKDSKSPLNRACAAFFACLALWSFAYIFVHNLNSSKDTARLFDNISSIGWAGFASFFLWFSLIFTEKKKILKTKIIYPLIFIPPVLFIYTQWAGLLTTDYIQRPWGWEAAWSDSILWYSYYLYYISFTVIGLFLILYFGRNIKEPIKKKQAGIIFTAAFITLILGAFTSLILPGLDIDAVPFMGDLTILSWSFGIVFAMVKYKLMVISPAAAAENIISNIADSLILLDREGKIVNANTAALDLSGYAESELEGKSVEIFFGEKDFKNTLLDKVIQGETIRNYEFAFKTKTGNHVPVILSASMVMDQAGGIAGIACIVKDITLQRKSEEELKKSYRKLKITMNATIQTMSKILETRDPYTAGHQQRVSQLATAIAKELNLSQDKVEGIRIASLIHDIGKIGLPTEIMSKPTKLSDIEFNLIKEHSQIGYDILQSIDFSYPVAQIVLQHHERLNGSGYPQGLKDQDILPEAKIITVADVVEAMSSHRPYRPALGIDVALEEISQNKGILYDPEAVDTCLKLFKEKKFTFK